MASKPYARHDTTLNSTLVDHEILASRFLPIMRSARASARGLGGFLMLIRLGSVDRSTWGDRRAHPFPPYGGASI